MVKPHTVKRMKTTAILPKLADRNSRENWESKGSLDTHARAMLRVRDILDQSSLVVFPAELENQLRETFIGLVPGRLEPPLGWKR